MFTIEQFNIKQNDKGKYVIEGEGYKQDIDFVDGGFIETQEHAERVRHSLVDTLNIPPDNKPTSEERLAMLEMAMDNLLMGGL